MRTAFVASLAALMTEQPKIVLLTADLGYSVLEPLIAEHPDRVLNVGAAEQNMNALATGLAHSGMVPFVYSIATFATLRGYEFIRNGAVVHNLPVRVIGIGGGFEYGSAGISHYALEDLAIMRVQPGMTVVAPADGSQAAQALRSTWDLPGPVYYRVGKDDGLSVPELEGRFRLGRLESLATGSDVLLLATGSAVAQSVGAAHVLRQKGVSCGVSAAACLAPAPVADILETIGDKPLVMTVETHYRDGGLGSLVAEIISESGLGCRLIRAAVDRVPDTYSGSRRFMETHFGLDEASLVARILADVGLVSRTVPLNVPRR